MEGTLKKRSNKLEKITALLKRITSIISRFFGLALFKSLTFVVNKLRLIRLELGYKLHLSARTIHDTLVIKSPVYKKITENQYAVPVKRATVSAFVLSLVVFVGLQYLTPFLNPFRPGKVMANANSKTWDLSNDFNTNGGLSSATTKSQIDTSGDRVSLQSSWITGVGSFPATKSVYNTTLSAAWGPQPGACNSPQCASGLDTALPSKYSLVASNTVDFSVYPARNACKAIGGRLPTTAELQAIMNSRSSYGIPDPAVGTYANYWTSTALTNASNEQSAYIGQLWWYNNVLTYTPQSIYGKSTANLVRCVRDVPGDTGAPYSVIGTLGGTAASSIGLRVDNQGITKFTSVEPSFDTLTTSQAVKFRLRVVVADTNGNGPQDEFDTATWYGPSGAVSDVNSWTSNYFGSSNISGNTNPANNNVPAIVPQARYAELMLRLESPTTNTTPNLNSVRLNWNEAPAPSTLISKHLDGTTVSNNFINETTAKLVFNGTPTASGNVTPEVEIQSVIYGDETPSFTGNATTLNVTAPTVSGTINTEITNLTATVTGLSPEYTYYWKARYTDSSGIQSAWSTQTGILSIEQTAPTISTFQINSGATFVNSSVVTLNISASDTGGSNLSQMQFSNDGTNWGKTADIDGNITDTGWATYATSYSWNVAKGVTGGGSDTSRTVYARVKDNAGNITGKVYTNNVDLESATTSNIDSSSISSGNVSLDPVLDPYAANFYSSPLLNGNLQVAKNDNSALHWKTSDTSCVGPQCSSGVLVSPQLNTGVDFSGYPAQSSCIALGGRLPTNTEITNLYNNRASYGTFAGSDYWSATEYSAVSAYASWFGSSGQLRYWGKVDYNLPSRCVRDTSIIPTPYKMNGYLGETGTPLSYTAANTQKWTNLIYGADTLTTGQSIQFQISTDGTNWKGVDSSGNLQTGSWDTNYFGQIQGSAARTAIPASLASSTSLYIKVKLSSNGNDTPVLHDISIQSASSASITLDTQVPTGTVAIRGASTYVKDKAVTLNLEPSDLGPSGMKDFQLSNDGITWGTAYNPTTGAYTSGWQNWNDAYRASGAGYSWNLIKGASDTGGSDGERRVYVKYRDAALGVGGNYDGNWIPGQAETNYPNSLVGKYVYNRDINNTDAPTYTSGRQWSTLSNTKCLGPQCSQTILPAPDPYAPTKMVLVDPITNNSVDFSNYPAQQSCKLIGGRLPTADELLAIYSSKSTGHYQGSFTQNYYWTATEFVTGNPYRVTFLSGQPGTGTVDSSGRENGLGVRCVSDVNPSITTTVTLDTTKAATAITVNPSSPSGDSSWYKVGKPQVSFSSSDTTSKVDKFYYRWKDTDSYTEVSNSEAAQPFTFSFDAGDIPEGTSNLSYYAVDQAGNIEAAQSRSLKIDITAPSIGTGGYTISGAPNGSDGWYVTTAPTITLTASDPNSGTNSGMYRIYYQFADTGYQPTGTWSYQSGTTATFPAVEGNKTLYYYARDIAGNVEDYTNNHFQIKFVQNAPAAPTNFRATDAGVDNISLAWDPVEDKSGITNYRIRRRIFTNDWCDEAALSPEDFTTCKSDNKELDTTIGSVGSYPDNDARLQAGQKYAYNIVAKNQAGVWGSWYSTNKQDDAVALTIDTVDPSIPQMVSATACDGQGVYDSDTNPSATCTDIDNKGFEVKLVWHPATDAGTGLSYYKVWRSTDGSPTDETKWTVVGVVAAGSGPVGDVVYFDNDATNDANIDTDPSLDIGVYPEWDSKAGEQAGKVNSSSRLNDSGTKYYYRVTALDNSVNETDLFPVFPLETTYNEKQTVTPDVTAPAKPTDVTVVALGIDAQGASVLPGDPEDIDPDTGEQRPSLHQKIQVTWTESAHIKARSSEPATGNITYKVYRSNTAGSGYALVGTVVNGNTFDEEGLQGTTRYYYTVEAIDASGNPSGSSDETNFSQALTFSSDIPTTPINDLDVTKYYPSVVTAKGNPETVVSVGNTAEIRFKGSSSKKYQITGYQIWRAETNNAGVGCAQGVSADECWIQVNAATKRNEFSITPIVNDRGNVHTFTDTGLTTTKAYYYRVRAQDNTPAPEGHPEQGNYYSGLTTIVNGTPSAGWDITPDITKPTPVVQVSVKDTFSNNVYARNVVTWKINSQKPLRKKLSYESCTVETTVSGVDYCNDFDSYEVWRETYDPNFPNNPALATERRYTTADYYDNIYQDDIDISINPMAQDLRYRYYVVTKDDAGTDFRYQNGTVINKVGSNTYSNYSDKVYAGDSIIPSQTTPKMAPNTEVTILERNVSSAVVQWYTDQDSDSLLEYRLYKDGCIQFGADCDDWVAVGDRNTDVVHTVRIFDLKTDTRYEYRAVSRNKLGNDLVIDNAYYLEKLSKNLPELRTEKFQIVIPSNQSDFISPTTTSIKFNWSTTMDAKTNYIEYEAADDPNNQQLRGIAGQLATTDGYSLRDHSVILKGLRSNTKYRFKVKSVSTDNYPDEKPAGDGQYFYFETKAFDTGQFTSEPSSSNIAERNITSTTAQIIWETDMLSTSEVLYGTSENALNGSARDDTLTKKHVMRLEGLTPGQKYYYKVRVTDEFGQQYTSPVYSFVAVLKPKISNLQVKNVTPYSVTIAWETNVETETVLNWGKTAAYGEKRGTAGTSQVHQVVIEGLEDNQEYHYQVVAHDAAGNEVVDTDKVIRTPLDTEGPKITNAKVDILPMGENDATSSIIVSWQTNKPSTTLVEYDEGIIGGTYNSQSTEDPTLNNSHTVIIKGLKPATSYHYRMVSKDKRGNKTESQDYTFVTPTKEKSILQMILKSLEETFAWTKNLGQFFANIGNRITGKK